MIVDILRHTPAWVFVVFAVLTVLGLRLTRPTVVPFARLVALPCVFTVLSSWSLVQAFGGTPLALAAWVVGFAMPVVTALARGPRTDVAYRPAARAFAVPGSWLPLVLMLSIFVTRYAVAVTLAIDAGARERPAFAVAAGFAYGVLSGALAARALRIGRVASRPTRETTSTAAA